MQSQSEELSDDDLMRVGRRIELLESGDEQDDQAKQELALLKESLRKNKAQKRLLQEELAAVNNLLRDARIREATHFRSHDNWDEEKQAPKEDFSTSSSFWMGDDWTSEEKMKLRAARAAIGLGTAGGVWSLGGGFLRLAGSIVGYEAAQERVAGDDTELNQLLRDQAGVAIGNEADGLLNVLNGAIAALTTGIAGYYYVSKEHSKRIDALNRPQASKDAEDFERSAEAVKARLLVLQQRLAEERSRLADLSKGKGKK